jgi:hypothetical protein
MARVSLIHSMSQWYPPLCRLPAHRSALPGDDKG